ncbi:unnamed protein product [Parnassius mnemosyne]
MYMDDIKIYAANERELRTLLHCTEQFSSDINMSFGLEKCRTMNVYRRRIEPSTGVDLQTGGTIGVMTENDTYKYLGILQSHRIQHGEIRSKMIEVYNQRLKGILSSGLNGRNLVKAINTFAIPVLTYTFGIVNWSDTELERVERSTRVMLTKYLVHHPKSAVERVTLPRAKGGRGLIDIRRLCAKQVQSLRSYFLSRTSSSLHHVVTKADDRLTTLDLLHADNIQSLETDAEYKEAKLRQWASKPLHGRFANELTQPYVDIEASNNWLKHGEIFAETEGFMVAIQDQVMPTKNYLRFIVKTGIEDDQCRRCHQKPETIQHITGGCQVLAGTEYTQRHDNVAKIIHQELAVQHGLLKETEPYWKYNPSPVLENDSAQLYWDRSVLTDRTVEHNRPDIILVEKEEKRTWLLDIGIPNSHNVQKYITEKMVKYQRLAEEIRQLRRQQQVHIVPLILSTTGIVPKSLTENLAKLGISVRVRNKIQKAVILDTTAIVRRHLSI